MWVKCTGVGVFSIQEKIGESPQVSFLRSFVYSSQIKGWVVFFLHVKAYSAWLQQ